MRNYFFGAHKQFFKINFNNHLLSTRSGKIFAREWVPENDNKNLDSILLLHDSLGCVSLWRNFPELLARKTGCKVIAYDRLGYGESEARSDLLSLSFIEDESDTVMPEIIKHFNLKKFILFGHSVGGGMAIVSASKFGKYCSGVITESAQAFVEEHTLKGIKYAKESFEDSKKFERLKKYHGEKASWVLNSWTETWLDPKFASWSLRKSLSNIKCPMLALHGDKDEFGSIQHPSLICDLAGGHSQMYLINNCGHVPHKEKTEEVLNLVASFLYDHALEYKISNSNGFTSSL